MYWFTKIAAALLLAYTLPLPFGLLAGLALILVPYPKSPAPSTPALPEDTRLDGLLLRTILRHKLSALHNSGAIGLPRYQLLTEQLQQLDSEALIEWQTHKGVSEAQLLELAWEHLQSHQEESLGRAPWITTLEKAVTARTEAPVSQAGVIDDEFLGESIEQILTTSARAETPPFIEPAEAQAKVEDVQEEKVSAWGSRLSRLRELTSEVLFPFLWQNIGWFIGGFCFLSGSIFLITYTSGFTKGVTVFANLTLYAMLLFWGGYQMRKRRPALRVSSQALFTLAVLMVPLALAAATRLLLDAEGVFEIAIALLFALLGPLLFWLPVRLAAGLQERILDRGFVAFFLPLAAVQYALPLVEWWPNWVALLLLHLLLLLLLTTVLHRFGSEWLKALFIDQHHTAGFAIGALLFAATVSAIHLHLSSSVSMPVGYPGPLLMVITLLLLQADTRLRLWVDHFALLGRFTFVIYALSVLALLLSLGSAPMSALDGWALPLTLALGLLLYLHILWHYLTLAALTLLVLSGSLLYWLLLLRHCPQEWALLFSLPALSLVYLLLRMARARRVERTASSAFHHLIVALLLLLGWSLWQAQAGIAPLLSIAVTLGLLHLLKGEPDPLWQRVRPWMRGLVWLLPAAYLPLMLDAGLMPQLAVAYLLQAALFALFGQSRRPHATMQEPLQLALISIALSLLVSALAYPAQSLIFSASGSALLLMLLSLRLGQQTLLYLALACAALGYLAYRFVFELPTTHGGIYLLLPTLYAVVLTLRHLAVRAKSTNPEQVCRLFGLIAISDRPIPASLLLLQPLTHMLYLLWLVAVVTLFGAEPGSELAWRSLSLGLVILLIYLGGGWRLLLPGSLLLLVLGLFTLSTHIGTQLAMSAGGLLLLWWVVLWLLNGDCCLRRLLCMDGWLASDEPILLTSIGVLMLSAVGLHSEALLSGSVSGALLPFTLMAGALFVAHAGWRYQNPNFSYPLIVLLLSTITLFSAAALGLNLSGMLAWLVEPTQLPWPLLTLTVVCILLDRPRLRPLLYAIPLRHTATLLALFATLELLVLLLTSPEVTHLPVAMLVVGLCLIPLTQALPFGEYLRSSLVPLILLMAWIVSGNDGAWTQSTPLWLFIGAIGLLLLHPLALLIELVAKEMAFTLSLIAPISVVVVLLGLYQWLMLGMGEPLALLLLPLWLLLLREWVGWRWPDHALALLLIVLPLAIFWQSFANAHQMASCVVLTLVGLTATAQLLRRLPLLDWELRDFSSGLGKVTLFASQLMMLYLVAETALTDEGALWLNATVLLALLYPLWLWPSVRRAEVALGALLLVAWRLLEALDPPLSTALITLLPAALFWLPGNSELQRVITLSALRWLNIMLVLTLLLLALQPAMDVGVILPIGLLLLASLLLAAMANPQRKDAPSQVEMAWGGGWVLLHLLWLLPLFALTTGSLITFWMVQAGVLAWCASWAARHACASRRGALLLEPLASKVTLLWLIALLLWLLHVALLLPFEHEFVTTHALWQILAASATLVLIGWLGWQRSDLGLDARIYLLSLLWLLLVVYLRSALFGAPPATLWDSIVLLLSAWALMILHHFYPAKALYRLALITPALLLLTVPLQLASMQTTVMLFATAPIYLALQRDQGTTLPLYLALLLLNGACYLWVPDWVAQSQLIQLYAVPIALSLLVLLQMHRPELSSSVRHRVRLVALAALYLSATLDLFLVDTLWVFFLALGLSLAGIIIGIALQIRAFLYTATLSLIFNVMGQLLNHYPEGTLGKAVALMVVGVVITGAMIGFNIQRERIMLRWRVVRADLAHWE